MTSRNLTVVSDSEVCALSRFNVGDQPPLPSFSSAGSTAGSNVINLLSSAPGEATQ